MADVNSVVIVGRLTRDAERRGNGGPLSFSIASSRRVKHGEEWSDEASFFEVTYWHKSLDQYLTKGKQIAVSGALVQEHWEKDGEKRSKVTILADNVQLLGGGQAGQTASVPDGFPAGGQPRGEAAAVPAGFPDAF